jgi:polar amino acid transport system substrate-binding protein
MNKLILAAAALLALTLPVAAQTRLGTEGAYPPFNYVDDAGQVGGYDIDVANEACKRAGLECSWVVNEWDTIIPNLISGNYDAIVAALSITEERKKTVDFTEQYFPPDPSTFMTPAGKTFDFDNLSGVRIGVQGTTIQATHADATFAGANEVLKYDSADQALADLNAGNIDMVFAEKTYVGETVAGSSGALVAAGPDVPLGDGYGFALRKADADLTAKLNEALASMKADGTLDALITLYFPDMVGGPFYDLE